MNVTKFGHSCLLLEKESTKVLIDPGAWSEGFGNLENLDAIFITHEHADHCDLGSLRELLAKNPQVKILTNVGVGILLGKENIAFELCEDGTTLEIKDIRVEAIGREHAVIYRTSPCANTGFIFDDRLYHPGDSLIIPKQPIELLALPVCAPWLKMSECVDFAFAVKPTKAFPVHDGMLKFFPGFHRHPGVYLPEQNIEFFIPENNQSFNF